ncbi:hypothetical protein [Parvularcula sp. LCG005]|uniref:hypothetical protein n=1 Tax=Parvularcula sp. LCG005 TaxID=3078805 RepID=UPI002943F6A3|nr:hypothetical protein [Parvularcula sp. LCG005]WOI53675.1 hypothetical protein RUI03_01450 [Parvularcula sp. LCG005]
MENLRGPQDKDENSRQRFEHPPSNEKFADVERPATEPDNLEDQPLPVDLTDDPVFSPEDARTPEQNETYNADKGVMKQSTEDDPDPTGERLEQDLGDLSDATPLYQKG